MNIFKKGTALILGLGLMLGAGTIAAHADDADAGVLVDHGAAREGFGVAIGGGLRQGPAGDKLAVAGVLPAATLLRAVRLSRCWTLPWALALHRYPTGPRSCGPPC